jgi:predicted metal-dependent phosphotriesterase family hydrolase
MINTVTGEVARDQLGYTYLHEHLIIDSPIVAEQMPHISLPQASDAIAELQDCFMHGLRTMVDCMPGQSGRNLNKLREVSLRSKVNIIAATGMHNPKYYPPDHPYLKMSSNELAQLFIEELTIGAESTSIKCGIIKIFTLGEGLEDQEKRLFAAAAEAHSKTGAPILTHCEDGEGALSQIEFLNSLNVPLRRVVLSHTDKVTDLGYHRELWDSGVNLEYDQGLRQKDQVKPFSAQLTIAMIEHGFIDQLMLGTDGARRTLWRSLGGEPGLDYLLTGWSQKLRDFGVTDRQLNQIFMENPAQFLEMETVA